MEVQQSSEFAVHKHDPGFTMFFAAKLVDLGVTRTMSLRRPSCAPKKPCAPVQIAPVLRVNLTGRILFDGEVLKLLAQVGNGAEMPRPYFVMFSHIWDPCQCRGC